MMVYCQLRDRGDAVVRALTLGWGLSHDMSSSIFTCPFSEHHVVIIDASRLAHHFSRLVMMTHFYIQQFMPVEEDLTSLVLTSAYESSSQFYWLLSYTCASLTFCHTFSATPSCNYSDMKVSCSLVTFLLCTFPLDTFYLVSFHADMVRSHTFHSVLLTSSSAFVMLRGFGFALVLAIAYSILLPQDVLTFSSSIMVGATSTSAFVLPNSFQHWMLYMGLVAFSVSLLDTSPPQILRTIWILAWLSSCV
ncbi:hypothetical protein Scep_028254 [Stephania cephalantha]|uniref:Uncharacterized protein n=1 Tax=Stephania cephalantha TaxID=152367 RepID=A0AAP0HLM2_9MAGN